MKANNTCPDGQFTCTNGKCIDYHLVCNKVSINLVGVQIRKHENDN
jgi:Low-density lipoprotein receptor domain class A